MLKGLKNKKDGKGDVKKESKKEKKAQTRKQQEEEEEDTNDALVEINYDEKEKVVKNTKKVHASKLEEKEIDTSNIKIEKKEEKKAPTSWVVEEKDIDKMFKADFDAKKHETEFESLTNHSLNKELEEKAKKEEEQKARAPKIQEIAGIKYAPLQRETRNTVDVNGPLLAISKREGNAPMITFASSANPPQFMNSKMGGYTTLQKTPQQIREEEIEKKTQLVISSNPITKAPQIPLASNPNPNPPQFMNSKIGGFATLQKTPQQIREEEIEKRRQLAARDRGANMKVSGWAAKAESEGTGGTMKFAELKISNQEKHFGRKEQQYVFTSKKEQEERRKKREQEALKKGA